MADILLNKNNGYYDFSITNGDFTLTYGFETALLMSIYCEKRATQSEVPRAELRRGWWGNRVNDYDNYEQGSKLWLLDQSRNNLNLLNLVNTYSNDGLKWLIDDSHATKIETNSNFSTEGVELSIKLYRSQDFIINNSFLLWDNTL